ncbi:hypothetical protein D3C81_1464550 [compost metagenome]
MLQPVTQGGDPTLPTAKVAASGNRILQRLAGNGKAVISGPFQQTVEKCSRIGTARKAVDIGAAGNDFPRRIGVEAFVIKQLLRLWAVRCFIAAATQHVADAQSAVGGDPPVLAGLALGQQCGTQHGVIAWRLVMLVGRLGHFIDMDSRAV